MPNYIPKAEQIDVLNEKLTAINDTLKKKNDFTDAVKNLKDVTTKAEEATEKATTAAESVVSPSAKVTKSGDTATITITDKDGTTSAEVVDGSKGETPVKGTDYWTDSDKTEIVNDVLAALPTWEWGSY